MSLVINEAQQLVHEALEKQRRDTGRVRAIIIKGRQQGMSTYVQARFVWKLMHNRGLRAYILTHLAESTQALFGMTKRYIENLPVYKPQMGKCNVNELHFQDLDCGYKVGTAGSQGVGRGETIQLFHGSELGHWHKPEEHMSGILQAVPNQPGTEIILESTANGVGNLFHRMCLQSVAGKGSFKLIFVPWLLQDEYQVSDEKEFLHSEAELGLETSYGMSVPQLKWRRGKIEELGDERIFRQEYPMHVSDAFISDTDRAFITRAEIDSACASETLVASDRGSSVVMGVDPARLGGDDTGICVRVGRIVEHIEVLGKMDTMQLCGALIVLINRYGPDVVFIDMGSFGAAVFDRLKEQGYKEVRGINFGQSADDPTRYGNKRAEMYDRVKRWINDPPCKLPDIEQLKIELASVNFHENSSGKLMMERKEDMRKRGIASPGLADALCLTFADYVGRADRRAAPQGTYSANMDWDPFDQS